MGLQLVWRQKYADKLVEDEKIRKYLLARLSKGGVAKIVIERTLKLITVTIHTARPGIVIGKGGPEVDKLKERVEEAHQKDVRSTSLRSSVLNWMRSWLPTASVVRSRPVSRSVAAKMAIASTMRMGAEGCRVMVSRSSGRC